jgi:hypothetical protein
MRAIICTLALMAGSIAPTIADEHRQLGAHVHGHGTLDVAIEGNKISLALEAPGADIVGFEHEAASEGDKAALKAAEARLADPLALFRLPVSAGCALDKADVKLEAEDHDDDHDHAGHDDHDHDGHVEHHHAEFHADYVLTCKDAGALTGIAFDYFKAFAGAQSLTVNVAAAKGQASYEVSRDRPQLDLKGTM